MLLSYLADKNNTDTALLDDADDTAKVLLSCSLLGLTTSPKRMIEKFEGADHFRTYQHERNGSFSTNCNVLTALLHSQTPADYHDQITKIVKFLCREYLSGTINDKWVRGSSQPGPHVQEKANPIRCRIFTMGTALCC